MALSNRRINGLNLLFVHHFPGEMKHIDEGFVKLGSAVMASFINNFELLS